MESAVSAYPKLFLQQIGTIQMLSPSLRIMCGDWACKLFFSSLLFFFLLPFFPLCLQVILRLSKALQPLDLYVRVSVWTFLQNRVAPAPHPAGGCSSTGTSFPRISFFFSPFYFFSFLQTFQRSLTPDQLHIHFPRRLQEQIKLSSFLLC